jgi:aspartate/methionine/tyrosine aminotransferase
MYFSELEGAITPKTQAILMKFTRRTPQGPVYNPTKYMNKFVHSQSQHDLWIIDDMIYATLRVDRLPPTPRLQLYQEETKER